MAERINEEIRFYQPADPYYYQVDNLPLEDLLNNDVKLQDQIDALNTDTQNTIFRDGFLELRPYINTALPGSISVHPGSFIGRAQRSSGGALTGSSVGQRMNDGIVEINTPPTEGDDYNVSNPPQLGSVPAKYVGRNSVFNFLGGNITIDGFDFDAFQFESESNLFRTPPLGRLDLVGITTVQGAMDDPYLPGNQNPGNIEVGDGQPKLAVVKGAGMIVNNNTAGTRELVIGEKYITIGTPQEQINDYGRDLAGNVVPNPEFGTVPAPDDVVNACFSSPESISELQAFADNNTNASFFLPIAYVYVPQSHVQGNPIPLSNLKDIRPFFRTAELTLSERQGLAFSENPGYRNRVITQSDLSNQFTEEVNRGQGLAPMQEQIHDLRNSVEGVTVQRMVLDVWEKWRDNGYVGNGSTYDVTDAIKPEHRSKTIIAINVLMRPITWTGDINVGWIGVKDLHNNNIWVMNMGNDISHSSAILISPGNVWVSPRTDGAGNLQVVTAQSGKNQKMHGYVTGYIYEDTLNI